MTRWCRIPVGILLMFAVMFTVAGCSGSKKGQLATYKAKGKLQIDSKPFGPCTITFQPNPLTKDSPSAIGQVGADGTFTSLRTYNPGDGIPAGTYDVKVAPDAMGGQPVPGFKPKSVLVIKPDNGVVDLQVDLESTGGPSNDLPGGDDGTPPASI